MTGVQVRAATVADIPAITRIYGHAVTSGTASFELEAPDSAEMERRFMAVTGGGHPYLVGERDDSVLGYAYISQYRPRQAYRWSVENSIYIAPDAHRSGVGRELLAALIEAATSAGYRQMIAIIGDSRQSASIGLHREMGFTFSGTIHSAGYKNGRWLDSVTMQRALGDGDTTRPSPIRTATS